MRAVAKISVLPLLISAGGMTDAADAEHEETMSSSSERPRQHAISNP